MRPSDRAPNLFTLGEGSPFPRFIVRAIDRLADYYRTPSLLPSLNAANGSERQQRTERREACMALLGVMIKSMDILTLRVGKPTDEGFGGIRLWTFAEEAGLCLRRAERACHDLVLAGIVTVHPIAERTEDGEHIGRPAIRRIDKGFFNALKLGWWLKRERDKASKKASAPESPQRGRTALMVNSIRQRMKASPKSKSEHLADLQALLKKPPS